MKNPFEKFANRQKSTLCKRECSTFFFPKKKKVPKKKLASLQLDLLSTQCCKVRSLYAKAYLKVHILLDERNFAARRSFEFI